MRTLEPFQLESGDWMREIFSFKQLVECLLIKLHEALVDPDLIEVDGAVADDVPGACWQRIDVIRKEKVGHAVKDKFEFILLYVVVKCQSPILSSLPVKANWP